MRRPERNYDQISSPDSKEYTVRKTTLHPGDVNKKKNFKTFRLAGGVIFASIDEKYFIEVEFLSVEFFSMQTFEADKTSKASGAY